MSSLETNSGVDTIRSSLYTAYAKSYFPTLQHLYEIPPSNSIESGYTSKNSIKLFAASLSVHEHVYSFSFLDLHIEKMCFPNLLYILI